MINAEKSRPAEEPGDPVTGGIASTSHGTAYDRIVAALDTAGREPAEQSAGQTLARCSAPGHADRNPSLLVTAIEGRALLHCRAGCSAEAVMAGLGLTLSELFDSPRGASYAYTDAAGQKTLRTVHRTPNKRFRQDVTVKGAVPLFRLPRVDAAVKAGEWVRLVEGEQDVLALEVLGGTATTAPQGAANFHLVDAEPLRGAKVAVIPDVDAAGEKWAGTVLAKLSGVAAELDWRRPKVGKDAADHVAAGHGLADFEKRDPPTEKVGPPARTVGLTRASDIAPRATRWLWLEDKAHWLPLSGLGLFGGREGVGKTTTVYGLAAKITRGELPGDLFGQPRGVIISATEDGWSETVIPRLMACGADLDRVFRVQAVTPEGLPESVKLPEDLAEVERLVTEHDMAMIVLDPLMGAISGKLDSHRDHEVRLALEPLARLAAGCRVSIIGLIHANKSQSGDLASRVMGSRAFAAVARVILWAAREDDVPGTDPSGTFTTIGPRESFVLGQLKNNLSARVPHSLRFHIEGRKVGHDKDLDMPIFGSAVVFDGKISDTVQEIVTKSENRRPDRETAGDRAADWLEKHLTEHGPSDSRNVKDAAERAGHNERTLKRVLDRVGVVIVSVPGTRNVTRWSLRESVLTVPTDLTDLTVPTVPTPPNGVSRDSRDSRDSGTGTGEVVPTVVPTSPVSPQGGGIATARDSSQQEPARAESSPRVGPLGPATNSDGTATDAANVSTSHASAPANTSACLGGAP